jgi:hypothetical protein
MLLSNHRITTFLRAASIGSIVGMIAAVAGLAVEGWNVGRHGAEYSSYRFHFITFGALPGMLIAENQFGSDFQLGEVMQHKTSVVGWNALVFALLSSGAFCLMRRTMAASPPPSRAEKEAPNNTSHDTSADRTLTPEKSSPTGSDLDKKP